MLKCDKMLQRRECSLMDGPAALLLRQQVMLGMHGAVRRSSRQIVADRSKATDASSPQRGAMSAVAPRPDMELHRSEMSQRADFVAEVI